MRVGDGMWRGARRGALALAFASVSSLALAAPHKAATDPRDAKINQLEQDVQQLMQDNQRLHAEDQQLAARAQDLEAEVQTLKAGQDKQAQTIATATQTIQTVQASEPPPPSLVGNMLNGRPIFASPNGRFTLTLHTVMQLDTGGYFQPAAGPLSTDLRRSGPALGATAGNVDLVHARDLKDGTDFRRARIGIDGTVFGDWDYRLLLDFGGSGVENTGQLYETWIQYSVLKPLRLRAGAFPPTIGLDDSASTNGMPFMERSAIEDMARGFAAGDTRLAAQAYGWGDHWLASFAVTGRTVGVLNTGTATAVPQTFGDQLGFVARVAASPLHGDDWLIHVGAHGSYVDRPPNSTGPAANGITPVSGRVLAFSNTQQLRIDGTKLINTGNIDARSGYTAGVELAAQKGPFLLQSEYEEFGVDRSDIASQPTFNGWYVEGVWTITGEPRVYNRQTAAFDAPIPAHPFNWDSGSWGAFEIGARYGDADLNYHAGNPGTAPSATAIRGGEEQNVSLDLNWYPNAVTKFMLDWEHVRILRLSPNAAIYQTPKGAQIGQTYDALAVRSQFSF